MNYDALQAAVRGVRFDAGQDVAAWLKRAYEQVWNDSDWIFKTVGPTAISVASATPVLPLDFGRSLEVYDDLGDALEPMDDREFESAYRWAFTQGTTGRPEAFKVVNRVLTVAPAPSQAFACTLSYKRRLCTRTAAGVLQVGNFALGTDLPFWPDPSTSEDHHYIIVLRAMIIGRVFESDLTAQLIQGEYEDALTSMREDLLADHGSVNLAYGADEL